MKWLGKLLLALLGSAVSIAVGGGLCYAVAAGMSDLVLLVPCLILMILVVAFAWVGVFASFAFAFRLGPFKEAGNKR